MPIGKEENSKYIYSHHAIAIYRDNHLNIFQLLQVLAALSTHLPAFLPYI